MIKWKWQKLQIIKIYKTQKYVKINAIRIAKYVYVRVYIVHDYYFFA